MNERNPHWWHWVRQPKPRTVVVNGKACEVQSKSQEPYTPSPLVRRRSIPSIACALYYQAWSLYDTKVSADNARPEYQKVSAEFYRADKAKVDKLIALLVFCEVEEKLAIQLAKDAWKDAEEEKFQAWSDKGERKGIARQVLSRLGYELMVGEPDGGFDSNGASFAAFANNEGLRGR